MSKSSSTLLLGAAGLGAIFLLGSKKASTSQSKSTKPSLPSPKSEDSDVAIEGNNTFTCSSLIIKDILKFKEKFDNISKAIISQFKITKDNINSLDPIAVAKSTVGKFNSKCVKDPKNMTLDEKIIFFLIGAAGLESLEKIFGVKYSEDMDLIDYPYEIIGYNCSKDENDIADYSTCEYIIIVDEKYSIWKTTVNVYLQQLAAYLGILDKENEVKAADKKLRETGQYP